MSKLLPLNQCTDCCNNINNVCKFIDDNNIISTIIETKATFYGTPFAIFCNGYYPNFNSGYDSQENQTL